MKILKLKKLLLKIELRYRRIRVRNNIMFKHEKMLGGTLSEIEKTEVSSYLKENPFRNFRLLEGMF